MEGIEQWVIPAKTPCPVWEVQFLPSNPALSPHAVFGSHFFGRKFTFSSPLSSPRLWQLLPITSPLLLLPEGWEGPPGAFEESLL